MFHIPYSDPDSDFDGLSVTLDTNLSKHLDKFETDPLDLMNSAEPWDILTIEELKERFNWTKEFFGEKRTEPYSIKPWPRDWKEPPRNTPEYYSVTLINPEEAEFIRHIRIAQEVANGRRSGKKVPGQFDILDSNTVTYIEFAREPIARRFAHKLQWTNVLAHGQYRRFGKTLKVDRKDSPTNVLGIAWWFDHATNVHIRVWGAVREEHDLKHGKNERFDEQLPNRTAYSYVYPHRRERRSKLISIRKERRRARRRAEFAHPEPKAGLQEIIDNKWNTTLALEGGKIVDGFNTGASVVRLGWATYTTGKGLFRVGMFDLNALWFLPDEFDVYRGQGENIGYDPDSGEQWNHFLIRKAREYCIANYPRYQERQQELQMQKGQEN